MVKQIRCPKCGSQNFTVIGDSRKSLSLGKGVVGGVLLGPVGAVGGAIIGKKGKYDLICNDCKHRWIQKK